MRQIIKDRRIASDEWTDVASEGAASAKQVLLPLADYLAVRAGGPNPVPGVALAVKLAPADDAAQLKPYLADLPLIVVGFPSTAEGRGYTQGRLLSERFGYRGELRAAGGIRVDQVYLLARCGFNAFDLADGENLALAVAELERFSVAYQDGAGSLVHPLRRPPSHARS